MPQRLTHLPNFESRFQAIFDQSPFSIQIVHVSGKTLMVNEAWKKMWGLSEEFIEGFILKEYNILHDKTLEEAGHLELIKKAFAGEVTEVPEFLYDPAKVGHPGNAVWTNATLYPLKTEAGEVKEIVLMHEDITAKKRADNRDGFLARLKSILLSTLDYEKMLTEVTGASIPFLADGCSLDIIEDGELKRILTRHREPYKASLMEDLQRLFPPSKDSPQPSARVLRSGVPELLVEASPESIRERCQSEEHAVLMERIGVRSSIAVPLSIRGKTIGAMNLLITAPNRRLFDGYDLELAMDMARNAAMSIQNSRLYQESVKAVNMRDEFISVASHELKTPITTLSLQMKVLASALEGKSLDESGFALKVLGDTQRQVGRLTRLVNDMLDISRIDSGKMSVNFQTVDLVQLTNDVLYRFKEKFTHKNFEVRCDFPEELVLDCDPFRIDQVITNLMTNALKHGKSPVMVRIRSDKTQAILEVEDKGAGIPRQDQGRIFDRFERLEENSATNGLGLGLYICKTIINEHSGSLVLESAPGQGTRFITSIPFRRFQ